MSERSELTAVNAPAPSTPGVPARAAPLGSKGAVGAVSRALAQMSSNREAAEVQGADVVEIDVRLIVESDFKDRLEDVGSGDDALLASIREAGQQVPILVRPAPKELGKYQIAYGRRRVAALRALGRPVRALIRPMSDDEMIVAQGAENGARKDLSFIERSHFAWALEGRGVERSTIMAALSVDKTELSRLISVMRAMPPGLVRWVGPAPKTGRRRWMDLSRLVEPAAGLEKAERFMEAEGSAHGRDSDGRFDALLCAVQTKAAAAVEPWNWTDETGRRLARVERSSRRFVLSIDEAIEPAFGDYLLEQLPTLLASFRARR